MKILSLFVWPYILCMSVLISCTQWMTCAQKLCYHHTGLTYLLFWNCTRHRLRDCVVILAILIWLLKILPYLHMHVVFWISVCFFRFAYPFASSYSQFLSIWHCVQFAQKLCYGKNWFDWSSVLKILPHLYILWCYWISVCLFLLFFHLSLLYWKSSHLHVMVLLNFRMFILVAFFHLSLALAYSTRCWLP